MKAKSLFSSIVCMVILTLSISGFTQSKRELLKQKFTPGNFRQMQNIVLDQAYEMEEKEVQSAEPRRLRRDSNIAQTPLVGEYAIYYSEYNATIEEEIAFIKAKVTL